MKKTVIIVVGLLLCVVGATVIGQKKNLSPKEERREVREKRRADRIASFEKTMDSVILSRNFQFNPQTMQRQPAGPMRPIEVRPTTYQLQKQFPPRKHARYFPRNNSYSSAEIAH